MKITKRKFSTIDVPDIVVKDFINHIKKENAYKEYYLPTRETYSKLYPVNFMDIETFIKNHEHKAYCETIIKEDGMIENAQPSHEIAILLAYPLMDEDEYCLSSYNLIEYTGYIKVYYEYIYTPTYITKEQYNTVIRLIQSGCISKECYYYLKDARIIE